MSHFFASATILGAGLGATGSRIVRPSRRFLASKRGPHGEVGRRGESEWASSHLGAPSRSTVAAGSGSSSSRLRRIGHPSNRAPPTLGRSGGPGENLLLGAVTIHCWWRRWALLLLARGLVPNVSSERARSLRWDDLRPVLKPVCGRG